MEPPISVSVNATARTSSYTCPPQRNANAVDHERHLGDEPLVSYIGQPKVIHGLSACSCFSVTASQLTKEPGSERGGA
jgi:hypothetical protein